MKQAKAKQIRLYGIVQGIGFRPFVARLAAELSVNGSVCNRGSCVEVHAAADEAVLSEFERRLVSDAPQAAMIVRVRSMDEVISGSTDFEIIESRKEEGEIFVSPDLALCPDCRRELFDPENRRYLHPFINCTDCGPRLTILDSMPYDRERTSMAEFPMCPDCHYEYTHAETRRFHAQPVCCKRDGPKLFIPDRDLSEEACIRETRRILMTGGVAAVKGIGGFHLACDASSDEAVGRLRQLKSRPMKPFAVMMRDLETVRRECLLEPGQEELLTGSEKPILLLARRTDGGQKLSRLIAPDNPTVGVMLPYTPVHELLFRYPDQYKMEGFDHHADGQSPPLIGAADAFAFPDMLVMTSGNPSGAPICRTTEEAKEYLSPMCDVILSNNRKIRLRADDTVLRFADGKPYMIRRSRGYAPLPLAIEEGELPSPLPEGNRAYKQADPVQGTACVCPEGDRSVLAVGGELKNVFCLAKGDLYYPSPYVGDLGDPRSVEALDAAVNRMETLLEIDPQLLVCDLHPLYNSSAYVRASGLPYVEVQHHYAHILSCMAEHAVTEPVIGVSFDGTGYGTDGTVWGGEFLYCDCRGFVRAGSIGSFRQAGGDLAAKEGWRIAVSLLLDSFHDNEEALGTALALNLCSEEEFRMQQLMVERNINCVRSTSAGRLFDAVSAVLGIRKRSTFEGEASIALEYAARPADPLCPLPLRELSELSDIQIGSLHFQNRFFSVEANALIRRLAEGRLSGEDPAALAGGFHASLSEAVLAGCLRMREESGIRTAALSGGVFQNMLFLNRCRALLEENGFRVLVHSQVPANDGGIALGQALYGMVYLRDHS